MAVEPPLHVEGHRANFPASGGFIAVQVTKTGLLSWPKVQTGQIKRILSAEPISAIPPAGVRTRTRGLALILEQRGAGERIRTVDLRITSASSGDLPESAECPESQNPQNIEIPETGGSPEDP